MAAALREIPSSGCDVLIVDIGLPDGTGWELLERLDLPPHVYPIAYSGLGLDNENLRSRLVGFRHHLVKPIDAERLEQVLELAAQQIVSARETKESGDCMLQWDMPTTTR
jgi:CheY-like chemotaxis protein